MNGTARCGTQRTDSWTIWLFFACSVQSIACSTSRRDVTRMEPMLAHPSQVGALSSATAPTPVFISSTPVATDYAGPELNAAQVPSGAIVAVPPAAPPSTIAISPIMQAAVAPVHPHSPVASVPGIAPTVAFATATTGSSFSPVGIVAVPAVTSGVTQLVAPPRAPPVAIQSTSGMIPGFLSDSGIDGIGLRLHPRAESVKSRSSTLAPDLQPPPEPNAVQPLEGTKKSPAGRSSSSLREPPSLRTPRE